MYSITEVIKNTCIQKVLAFCTMFFLLQITAFSQSIQREVFSSAGNFNSTASFSLQSNIGELMVETYTNSSNILSEGFDQNDPLPLGVNAIDFKIIDGRAFPNPVVSALNIELNIVESSDVLIEVLDVLGKKQSVPLQVFSLNGKSYYELNLENINAGVYFVKITGSKNQFNQTFKITKI